MKKLLPLIFTCVAIQLSAQKFDGVDKSVMDMVYFPNHAAHDITFAKTLDEQAKLAPKMRVIYSRPLMNGRKVFGGLIKFNEPWRLGANESTEIQFFTPVMIGGTLVTPGRYTLSCIPTPEKWTLQLYSYVDRWGNYGYDAGKAFASVTAATQKSEESIEALSVIFYEKDGAAILKVGWENTVAEFPIDLL